MKTNENVIERYFKCLACGEKIHPLDLASETREQRRTCPHCKKQEGFTYHEVVDGQED